jgi:cell division protein ZapA
MRKIRESGKVVGLERIAVMAALNITNDMLQRNAESTASDRYIEDASSRLHDKLDSALAQLNFDKKQPTRAAGED